jgi:phage terminase large subunit
MVKVRATQAQRGALEAMLASNDAVRTVGIGGSRFLGKTWLGAWALGLMCLKYPGIHCLALRRVTVESELNMGEEIKASFLEALSIPCGSYASVGKVQYLSSESRFVFPHGSMIQLGYCRNEADAAKQLGIQWQVIWLEQAEQFMEEVFDRMGGSNRPNNPDAPCRMLLTFNPGGPGAYWVLRRVVSPETRDARTAFFAASIKTSYATLERDPGYTVRSLRSIRDPVLRQQWWDGDWDIFSGVFFTPRPETIRHIDVPWYAQWYGGVDWGRSSPFCCLWFAHWMEGKQRHLHCVQEVYQTELDLDEQAKLVLKTDDALLVEYPNAFTSRSILRMADASTGAPMEKASTEQSRSKADVWRQFGLYTTPNDRGISRSSGWSIMRMLMRMDIFTVEPRCIHYIREIKSARQDARGDDVDQKACADHALDAGRYLLTYLYPSVPKPPEDDPYEKFRRRTMGRR